MNIALTDKQFTKLLNHAVKISNQHHIIQRRLTDAFEARYGTTYSDVDCDVLIDTLDYGYNYPIDYQVVDYQMASCGANKLRIE